jgi:DNA polymerase I-like protein with 3'-5' exonuclease and polymerase domains
MKINNDKSSAITSAKSAKKSSSTSSTTGASFASFLNDISDIAPAFQAEETQILSPLFFDLENQEQSKEKGNKILSSLDKLRLEILSGEISKENLSLLSLQIKDQKLKASDPKLQNILQEIETRAAVELAKMERAGIFKD